MQAYLESEEYAKLQESLSKADDEDEYKNDTDPQGFFAYKRLVSGRLFLYLRSKHSIFYLFLICTA